MKFPVNSELCGNPKQKLSGRPSVRTLCHAYIAVGVAA